MTKEFDVDEQKLADALEQMEIMTKKREAVDALKGCVSFIVMLLLVLWFLVINSAVGYLLWAGLCV